MKPARTAAGALALALPLALAPTAPAQSQSGITINDDVLNSLDAGAETAPLAPPAPAAPPTPLSPRTSPDTQPPAGQAPASQAQPYQAQPYQAPAVPPADGGGAPTFQPYGDGSVVVTRPSTLLFPPLEPPTSTLAPGLANQQPDNHAARNEAMSSAFAEGPEPSSQLLIPLDDSGPGGGASSVPAGNAPNNDAPNNDTADSSVAVFMDNLPPADDSAAAADAPRLTLRRPQMPAPQPAPRKPEVSPEMRAEIGEITVYEPEAALAPEFQAPETPEAPTLEVPSAAPLAEVETAAIEPEPAPGSEPAPQNAAVPGDAMPTVEMPESGTPARSAEREPASDAPVSLLPAESADSARRDVPANSSVADSPVASADVPAPVTPAPAAESTSPGVQTAELTVGPPLKDMSVSFNSDSAELSDPVQAELRNLAESLRTNRDGRIQVLGFASAKDGSQDLARKLALSRALKVRTFLIDAGVPSTSIQVRSLGDQSGGGPANRVDIRPIDS